MAVKMQMVDVNIYRDEAASLLGQYLLKGYKMLSSHCLSCGTVLVQKKAEKEICVLCDEILPKVRQPEDDSVEAISQQQEDDIRRNPISSTSADDQKINNDLAKYDISNLQYTRRVLLSQILKASRQLEEGPSVISSTQLCTLITTAATTLKTLKDCDKTM